MIINYYFFALYFSKEEDRESGPILVEYIPLRYYGKSIFDYLSRTNPPKIRWYYELIMFKGMKFTIPRINEII